MAAIRRDGVDRYCCRASLDVASTFEWRGEAAFRHWLYLRAQHKLIDKARHVGAVQRSPVREIAIEDHPALLALANGLQSPSGEVASVEELARIEQAFGELPDDYREAISLQRMCEMGYPEIAERMGRTEGAVRNLVYRGLSQLALRLGELGEGAQMRVF